MIDVTEEIKKLETIVLKEIPMFSHNTLIGEINKIIKNLENEINRLIMLREGLEYDRP